MTCSGTACILRGVVGNTRVYFVLAALSIAAPAQAVTSSPSVPSSMEGNGHNISFDGRLFIVRDGIGWRAQLLRPEAVTYRQDGLPDASGPMWSPRMTLLTAADPGTVTENALAICEPDPSRAPYACNEAGDAQAGGPYDCYDVWLIDSDAVTPPDMGGFYMRRRHLMLWVANPRTATASVHKFALSSTLEQLTTTIRGIEPTVTKDGKLLVWQGHPDNDGTIDILMYSVNANACAAAGWSAPKVISSMATDPAVVGTYRLADRTLRGSDGSTFAAGDLVRGAYPWLMPSGDAVVFQASPMPCRATEDPPGCGPRRNSFAVVGYPTNWGIAIVDGGVNPFTDNVVRLFFSSPGPHTFPQLPVTSGVDVWPFMGSNTSNYAELIFDDGLDGNYAGFWHFNENVNKDGELDLGRVPDVSGYFNTGVLHGGLQVATANNGVVGRALTFDGLDDRVEVAHSLALNPVNGVTIDFWIRPTAEPDCDGNNNYRLLLSKGGIGGGIYSVVLEESRALQVRLNIDGAVLPLIAPPVSLHQWTHVSCEYDGPSGAAGCWYDDASVVTAQVPSGTLLPNTAPLTIGAAGARTVCPDGDGAFAGMLDELSISRYARRLGGPPAEPDAGPGPDASVDAGIPPGDMDAGLGADDTGGGCGCRTTGGTGGALGVLLGFVLIGLAAVRTAGRRDRRRQPAR